MTLRYSVNAFNTATASTNKIHDDTVAREYGFRGGLVPGVDVYAYMTHLPVAEWGRAWLERGAITARFVQPVYDGEQVTVTADADGDDLVLEVSGVDGVLRASGRATRAATSTDRPVPVRTELPAARPPASEESLRPGTVLGSLSDRFEVAMAGNYLRAVREALPLYIESGVAHPGWVLRQANSILAANVVLGPWIHVSSDITLLGVVTDGGSIDVRAEVGAEYERRGHRFVELDVAVLADGEVVQRIAHTAIHTPRRLAHSAG
jgi:MaoC like domain